MLSKRRLVRPRSDYAARATAPKHYALGTASLRSAGHGPERFTGAAFDADGELLAAIGPLRPRTQTTTV